MKIFLDTNVLISALTTRGLCADVFNLALTHQCLLTAYPVLDELKKHLSGKFRLPDDIVDDYLDLIRTEAVISKVKASHTPDICDPDDIPILQYALGGKADYFITGDKALCDLSKFEGMPILTPREFWQQMTEK